MKRIKESNFSEELKCPFCMNVAPMKEISRTTVFQKQMLINYGGFIGVRDDLNEFKYWNVLLVEKIFFEKGYVEKRLMMKPDPDM
jgi:hypothetical protein